MKWFKHLSGSLNDSVIFEAIERFGSDAYVVFFGTLELMADEFDIHKPGVSRISIKKMTKNFQLSRQKTVKILSFFDQKAKEKPQENISFFVSIGKTHVVITCWKLKELCDEWTKKKLKELQSNSEATPDSLPPKEEEEEEDSPKGEGSTRCLHKEIINLYHETLPELRTVKAWGEPRRKLLRSRWKEAVERQNIKWWSDFFLYVKKSKFLTGKTKKPFQADLEWLVRPTNMVNVLEGKYHDREGPGEIKQPEDFCGDCHYFKERCQDSEGKTEKSPACIMFDKAGND